MKQYDVEDDGWRIPDALWERIHPLVPPGKPHPLDQGQPTAATGPLPTGYLVVPLASKRRTNRRSEPGPRSPPRGRPGMAWPRSRARRHRTLAAAARKQAAEIKQARDNQVIRRDRRGG